MDIRVQLIIPRPQLLSPDSTARIGVSLIVLFSSKRALELGAGRNNLSSRISRVNFGGMSSRESKLLDRTHRRFEFRERNESYAF